MFDPKRELMTQAATRVMVGEEEFSSLEAAIQSIITNDGDPDDHEVRAYTGGEERAYEPGEIRALIDTIKDFRP